MIAWGKLKENKNGMLEEHSLLHHMLDVAACFKAILATQRISNAINKLAGRSLTITDIERLTVLAFLHDMGKANAGF
jgi:CRISPR-associated endonuclease/helicase Cas3